MKAHQMMPTFLSVERAEVELNATWCRHADAIKAPPSKEARDYMPIVALLRSIGALDPYHTRLDIATSAVARFNWLKMGKMIEYSNAYLERAEATKFIAEFCDDGNRPVVFFTVIGVGEKRPSPSPSLGFCMTVDAFGDKASRRVVLMKEDALDIHRLFPDLFMSQPEAVA